MSRLRFGAKVKRKQLTGTAFLGDGTRPKDIGTALRMTRRAVLLSAATLPLAGCWLFPAEWYEKLTVTIETPMGDKTGSSVHWQKLGEDMLLDKANRDFAGEAVVVEVATGKYLFVLLEENKPQTELIFFPGEPPLKSTHKLNDVKGQAVEVPTTYYPLMATFANLDDPKSIKEVVPNNLAATFGPGYKLKSFTIEIVDGPIVWGQNEKLLPWLKSMKGNIGRGENLHYGHFRNKISAWSFIRKAING
jgi:hypothetical protein